MNAWQQYFTEYLEERLNHNKPYLLLLHGMFGSGANWAGFAREWSAKYTVLSPNLPCHDAPGVAGDLDYSVMAQYIATVLQAKGLRVSVLGHSMGAKVGMILALQFPEVVDRLVIVDIAAKTYPLLFTPMIDALCAVDVSKVVSRSAVRTQLLPYVDKDEMASFFVKSLRAITTAEGPSWEWSFDLLALKEAYPRIASWPFDHVVGKSSALPTLVVLGALSPYVKAEDHTLLQTYFPALELRVVPDAGHWVHSENRQGFLDALAGFIEVL